MKKLFALVLAACLMLSAVAFATGSKTSDDLTDVVDVETEVETEDTIDVELAMSEEAEAVLGKIAEQGVEETFGEALEDANDWTLTELVEIEIEGYEEEDGSLTVTLAFPTVSASVETIAMLGIQGEEEIAWTRLPSSVTEDGRITVTFTPEQAKQIADGTAFIAILTK